MEKKAHHLLTEYLSKWELKADKDFFCTHSSLLQPSIYMKHGVAKQVMLKIPLVEEEKQGSELMAWWGGVGAVSVLRHDGTALLLERIADNNLNLVNMTAQGGDGEATRIICQVADLLHEPRSEPLPKLTPLKIWFSSLLNTTTYHDTILAECAAMAHFCLLSQEDICVLHGDLHHQNILYSETYGWVALDPKGLYGERTFDYANILCNPNETVALSDGRLDQQIMIISQLARLSPKRLLEWTIAWAGLSALWMIDDGMNPYLPIEIAKRAKKMLQENF